MGEVGKESQVTTLIKFSRSRDGTPEGQKSCATFITMP